MKIDFLEQRPDFKRDATYIGPGDTGTGIEIHPQLVGMLQIAGTHGMRVQFNAAQVYNPRKAGRIIDYDFLRSTTRRKRQRHRAEPRRSLLRRTLLIERLLLCTV